MLKSRHPSETLNTRSISSPTRGRLRQQTAPSAETAATVKWRARTTDDADVYTLTLTVTERYMSRERRKKKVSASVEVRYNIRRPKRTASRPGSSRISAPSQ